MQPPQGVLDTSPSTNVRAPRLEIQKWGDPEVAVRAWVWCVRVWGGSAGNAGAELLQRGRSSRPAKKKLLGGAAIVERMGVTKDGNVRQQKQTAKNHRTLSSMRL